MPQPPSRRLITVIWQSLRKAAVPEGNGQFRLQLEIQYLHSIGRMGRLAHTQGVFESAAVAACQ